MARVGVRIENDPQLTPEDYRQLAGAAEMRGYEMVWMPEGSGGWDSLTQLTSIALSTRRIHLGTGILPIFARTPMATAMSAAGLAALSEGRFVLGLGVGHRPSVEATHGVAFRRPMTRMRETLIIVQKLLQGEQVSYQGKVFRPSDSSLGAGAPQHKVPVYVAALGPQMLELAGELADGVLLNWTAARFLEQAVQHVRQGAARVGRDPAEIDIAGYVRVAVVEDETPARDSLKRQIARYASNPFYRNFFAETGFHEEMALAEEALQRGDLDGAAKVISREMQDQVAIVGDADKCRQELEQRRALGLQLPVVAPFSVGDTRTTYQRAIATFQG